MGSRSRRVLTRYTSFGFDFSRSDSYIVVSYSFDGGLTWEVAPRAVRPEPPYQKWAKEQLLQVPRLRLLPKMRRPQQDKFKNKREPWRRPPRKLVVQQRPGRVGYRGRRVRRRP